MNENSKQPKRRIASLETALVVLLGKETVHQRCDATEMIHQQTGRKVSLSGDLSESELAELRKIPNVVDGESIFWENMIGLAVANGMSLTKAKKLSPKYWLGWWRAHQSKSVTAEAEPVQNAVQQSAETIRERGGKDPMTWSSAWKISLLTVLAEVPSARLEHAIISKIQGKVTRSEVQRALSDLENAKWTKCGDDGICLTEKGTKKAQKKLSKSQL